MTLKELMLTVFLLNLPFGHMRSKAVPYSRKWMLAVHLPVPFVIILRIFSGFTMRVIPLMILADIAGQLVGGKLGKIRPR